MLRQKSWSSKRVLLMILLIFGFFRKLCEAQVRPHGADGAGGAAFFALRSCHQLLHGNSGEFFSPDYLCSNPSLWCNWTIQVDPGKRIHLHLGDLTPDDVCHLKQDQIHVDEPTGPFGVHGILQTCWQEARYTSSSNTLYVVLLIGGWPSPPYRGFYGRYQAFGPPVAFNPQEGFTGGGRQSTPSAGLMDLNEPGVDTNAICPGCVCRLKAGVLYILWLQTGPAPGGPQVHKTISSILQGLIATSISLRENHVNECGTQLVLCDVNADCVNQFGTYSCRLHRLKSRGEQLLPSCCVPAGCGSGLSAETKGVYVLFFLLSSLFLILVVVAAMMYHRHHRGSFLVRCHSNSSSHSFSPPDLNNNNNQPHHGYSCPGDSHLPPPPVPARGPRGGWTQGKEGSPAIDLRLLRFSLLQPPDGCQEKYQLKLLIFSG
uniref:CUB domain-containing protein n=1 Tax=Mastacembelus armatus TaxID=205130 RepID=A0A7N8XZP0_9TELE